MPVKIGTVHLRRGDAGQQKAHNLKFDAWIYQLGLGSSLNTSCSANPQRSRIILKYSLSISMLMCVDISNSSRLMMAQIQRRPHGQIRADRCVHGNQRTLDGLA